MYLQTFRSRFQFEQSEISQRPANPAQSNLEWSDTTGGAAVTERPSRVSFTVRGEAARQPITLRLRSCVCVTRTRVSRARAPRVWLEARREKGKAALSVTADLAFVSTQSSYSCLGRNHWTVAMSLPVVSRLFRRALKTQLVPAANVTSKPAKHNITAGVSSRWLYWLRQRLVHRAAAFIGLDRC